MPTGSNSYHLRAKPLLLGDTGIVKVTTTVDSLHHRMLYHISRIY